MLRQVVIFIELVILSALILAARCANYQDVFFAGNIYFTDADCYARMTRARLCAEHPGLIVRHHDFENFPAGTTPHTTAPLDYLIVGLSILLQPFTAHALDLAGAFISPLLALSGGWFLWWWSRRMKCHYRWILLILYAISPILVHGTELGRPDHQSLSILLVVIAICAEWSLRTEPTRNWSIISGAAWALAIWVTAYEPLLLLLLLLMSAVGRTRRGELMLIEDRHLLVGNHRRSGWIVFSAIILIAVIIERRVPSLSIFQGNEIFKHWSQNIGELTHVPFFDSIWFRWVGYMLVIAPVLIWLGWPTSKSSPRRVRPAADTSKKAIPIFVFVFLGATYLLTIWQARWAYFFVIIFAILLPFLLEQIKSPIAVWIAFILSIFPVLRDWDEHFWPNEIEYLRRVEQRRESAQLRDLAANLKSPERRPFLAPWWISPEIVYWSGQPAAAGSSHESLDGIADSARFFLAEDWEIGREILIKHETVWVLAYDSERLIENSSAILGKPVANRPQTVCFVLDRTPARAPQFLNFSVQNGVGKLYRVVSNR